MLFMAFDAGASKAGFSAVRATREPGGFRFACLRHAHVDLMLDGGEVEANAVSTLIGLFEWSLSVRDGSEPIVVVVEGVEGHVYAGRSSTHLFDTADQAGGIRLCARTWARMRGVSGFTVKRTTASAVRAFLFGKTRGIGDDEVVLTVRGCVSGMPLLRVPVPDERTAEGKAIHSYDAAAIALVEAAKAFGLPRISLPDAVLAEIAKYRALAGSREAEKKARAALKAAGVKVPRAQSRHTRRRRSEAAIAAARRAS